MSELIKCPVCNSDCSKQVFGPSEHIEETVVYICSNSKAFKLGNCNNHWGYLSPEAWNNQKTDASMFGGLDRRRMLMMEALLYYANPANYENFDEDFSEDHGDPNYFETPAPGKLARSVLRAIGWQGHFNRDTQASHEMFDKLLREIYDETN